MVPAFILAVMQLFPELLHNFFKLFLLIASEHSTFYFFFQMSIIKYMWLISNLGQHWWFPLPAVCPCFFLVVSYSFCFRGSSAAHKAPSQLKFGGNQDPFQFPLVHLPLIYGSSATVPEQPQHLCSGGKSCWEKSRADFLAEFKGASEVH